MSQLAVLHLKDNDFGRTMFEVIETFSIANLLDFLKQLSVANETQVLSLPARGLSDIPGVIRDCDGLKKFDFSQNRCKHLSGFVGLLVHLTDLNLRANRLKDLPSELGAIVGMKLLDLGDNRLKEMPVCLTPLHSLTFLWLDQNEFVSIPSWFADLECLI